MYKYTKTIILFSSILVKSGRIFTFHSLVNILPPFTLISKNNIFLPTISSPISLVIFSVFDPEICEIFHQKWGSAYS